MPRDLILSVVRGLESPSRDIRHRSAPFGGPNRRPPSGIASRSASLKAIFPPGVGLLAETGETATRPLLREKVVAGANVDGRTSLPRPLTEKEPS
jgi:hypothetical protein